MANILIGKVLKPQGIKGEVKVKAFSNDLDRFLRYGKFIIDGKNYPIEKSRKSGEYVYIKFVGYNSMNDAEGLRNKDLYILDSELPVLKSDEYYVSDLLESEISFGNGAVGKIEEVIDDAKNIVITGKIDGKQAAFPLLKRLILGFDKSKKLLTIDEEVFNEVALIED